MRHSSFKRLFLLAVLLAVTSMVSASPSLHNLDIQVDLRDNGDAEIIETRQMSIDSEGTECYIVIDNLNGRDIIDFYVTDETGRKYTNIGEWEENRSRKWKTGKCGLVRKSDGYELCWGLGESGERTYIAHYVVTDMVLSYEESDGFNWMFVTRNMKPSPQSVNIDIHTSYRETGLPEDSVGVWLFGNKGYISKVDGKVKALIDDMYTYEAVIIVMKLEKDLLHPMMSANCPFEEVLEEAREGSDYTDYGDDAVYEDEPFWKTLLEIIFVFALSFPFLALTLFFILFYTCILIVESIVKLWERKRLLRNLEWYREIPLNGNLCLARKMMNAFYALENIDMNSLINAMVLRLVRTNSLCIEEHFLDSNGQNEALENKKEKKECFVIGTFDSSNRMLLDPSLKQLYDIFKKAAGKDGILQPKELKTWLKRENNEKEVMNFFETLKKDTMKLKEAKSSIDDVRKVFGLKKFLEDFTLANERHLIEVSLWKDYLVYAALFDIADQVTADMKAINPEFMNMDIVTRNMANDSLGSVLAASTSASMASVMSRVQSRNSNSSGGGGYSGRSFGGGGIGSFGGGGGFSGGGSGGGVR